MGVPSRHGDPREDNGGSEIQLSLMEKSTAYNAKILVDLVAKLFFDEMFLPVSSLDAVTVLL